MDKKAQATSFVLAYALLVISKVLGQSQWLLVIYQSPKFKLAVRLRWGRPKSAGRKPPISTRHNDRAHALMQQGNTTRKCRASTGDKPGADRSVRSVCANL